MRFSNFGLTTLKEVPADAEIVSHQLMLRAGLIRRLASGLFTWMPLGLRVMRKVEEIVSKAAPRRFIRVNHRHEADNVIVVEATLLDPDKGDDWQIPFVAVLNFENGKIAIDRTYADWRNWPGFA